jgi:hypothetical protein
MANVNHSTLTDPFLHEPKGVAAASSGDVYLANGAGSGSWTSRQSILTVQFPDISTASDLYVPIPYAGTITKIQSALTAAISGGDAVFTITNSAGASMGTLTITQSGSAAGDVDTLAPSSNNTVTAGSFIKIACAGAPSSHVEACIVICVDGS